MAFTNVYAANYKNAFQDSPAVKIQQGEYGGRKLVMYDQFTLDADGGASETVYFGRLPKGALVLNARLFTDSDLGGTGTIELGHTAGLNDSTAETLNVDAFLEAADASGQAEDVISSESAQRGSRIGGTRLADEVDVIATFTGATSSATGAVVTVILEYVLT